MTDQRTADIADPIPRDRYKRPMVVPPGKDKPVAYQRVTTLAGMLEDRYNLERWKCRQVALGLSLRHDLQALVASHREDKDALNQVIEDAMEAAAASERANLGTALHAFAAAVDRGLTLVAVPPQIQRDLDAYRRTTEALPAVAIEQFVVVDSIQVAGTPDRVLQLPDGSHVIADLKTGDQIDLSRGAIAIQLACYSRGVFYDPTGPTRTPLPDVDQTRALVIHVPAGSGRCDLHWVNIERGWDAALTADWIKDYRRANLLKPATDVLDLTIPYPTGTATAPTLFEQIQRASSVDELTTLYHANRSVWTQQHTDEAAARKAVLLT